MASSIDSGNMRSGYNGIFVKRGVDYEHAAILTGDFGCWIFIDRLYFVFGIQGRGAQGQKS